MGGSQRLMHQTQIRALLKRFVYTSRRSGQSTTIGRCKHYTNGRINKIFRGNRRHHPLCDVIDLVPDGLENLAEEEGSTCHGLSSVPIHQWSHKSTTPKFLRSRGHIRGLESPLRTFNGEIQRLFWQLLLNQSLFLQWQ